MERKEEREKKEVTEQFLETPKPTPPKKLTAKERRALEEQERIAKEKLKAEIREKAKKDPNYIHPLEQEALDELKKHPLAKGQSDKFLFAFLFARKLDIKRTIELLEKHFAFLSEEFPDWETCTWDDISTKYFDVGFQLQLPLKRDKEGNGISYLFMGHYPAKEIKFEQFFKCFVYLFKYWLWKEPLDYFRNGMTIVETIKDVSFSKNIDTSRRSQSLMKRLPNTFPFLIKHIYVCDAGFIVKALVKIARLFVKKKIIDRVQILPTRDAVRQFVEDDQLITEFGGSIKWNLVEELKQLEKECREQIDPEAIKKKNAKKSETPIATTTTTTTTTTTSTTNEKGETPSSEKLDEKAQEKGTISEKGGQPEEKDKKEETKH